MEFVPIFGHKYPDEDCFLWSVIHKGEHDDEVTRLLNLWQDVLYLKRFLAKNDSLLNTPAWEYISVNEAVMKIRHEAEQFDFVLEDIEDEEQNGKSVIRNEIFYNLHNHENATEMVSLKGKTKTARPILRLYGITLEHQIIITGGGIKLGEKIQNSPGLEQELDKIFNVKAFLRYEGIAFLP